MLPYLMYFVLDGFNLKRKWLLRLIQPLWSECNVVLESRYDLWREIAICLQFVE